MEKECSICKNIKPVEDFPRDNRIGRKGYDSRCKICMKNVKKEFKLKHPQAFTYHSRKWIQKNPEKHKAHAELHLAIDRGDIKKPNRCDKCKTKTDLLDGHHWRGYSPEHWLDVQWLCRQCHKDIG